MVEKTEPIKLNLFKLSIATMYIFYFFTFLGVTYIDKSKIHLMSIIIESIVCIILIIRFNPFRNHQMTDFDRAIIFSAASFLFINLITNEVYSQYTNNINELKDDIFKNINSISYK
jgi:hypothetical protein